VSAESGGGPRIGLFGGSFDPPHIAHMMVAAWALAGGEIDQLWVIPTGGHPFGKRSAPFDDRWEMCRRAFGCYGERVRLLDLERGPGVHYSVDTLRRLIDRHPGHSWHWVMGSDQLEEAHVWKQFDEIERLAPPLIIPRQGYPSPAGIPPEGPPQSRPEFALPDLSSTFIRSRLAEGAFEELAGLVPGPVLEVVRQGRLYRSAAADSPDGRAPPEI